jgi:hypothetical protein
MGKVRSERLTVRRDEGFVVFLIGARANHWWNLPILWVVGMAMGRMLKELESDPDSGLLSYEQYGGRTTLMVQYWRSTEDLLRYAKDRERQHAPAWREWIKRWGAGAMGIWHETYVVEPGGYECVYHHMPPFGLGRVGPLVPAEGELRTAAKRLGSKTKSAPLAA